MKKTLRFTLIVLLGSAIVIALILLSAPYLLEAFVLPRLLARAGLPAESVEVWRLTPFRLQGSVALPDGGKDFLTIPRLEISYTPGSLRQGRLTRLALDHAALHLELRDGRPALPTFEARPPAQHDDQGPLSVPLMVEEVVLNSCSLILREPGQPDLRIDLTARSRQKFSRAGDAGYRLDSLDGTFSMTDGISATGSLLFAAGEDRHQASLTVESGRLPALSRFLPAGLDGSMLGRLSLTSTFFLNGRTLDLEYIEASGSLSRFHAVSDAFEALGAGTEKVLEYALSGTPEKLEYKISGLQVTRPVRLSASVHGSAAAVGEGEYRFDGGIDTVLGGLAHAGEMADVAIPGTFSVLYSADRLEADVSLAGRPPPLGNAEMPIKMPSFSAAAHLVSRGDRLSAHISGKIPELTLPAGKLSLTDIALELPVELNGAAGQTNEAGSFSIGEIRLDKARLASLAGSITQDGEIFRLNGSARALFDPKLKAVLRGRAAPRDGSYELSWSLPDSAISSSSLPPIPGLPQDLSFDSRLAAEGNISYGPEGLAGAARGAIRDGNLSLPEQGLTLNGIDCSLELPRLPELVSSPSQSCTAAAIDVGRLHFSDAAATFRIENRETLFIEQSRANWSQGTVEFGSLRLSSDKPEIDTTLYCSHINMAELLNQFGFEQTEGQGSLNGRLPVRLSEKGLIFDEGFLFSTPGTGGIVRFTNTDMLRRGMADVGEAGYLSYALRAMENFAYDWTRLSFDTEGENLLLSMNLEGKPRTPLPFGFKDGRIVEAERGELQYPLRLDVNFRLPLAQLLEIGQSIKSLMENKQ